MAKKRKTQAGAADLGDRADFNIKDLALWRAVAGAIAPEEENERIITEIASCLCVQAGLMAENWKDIDRIANKSGGLAISWSFKSNRISEPQTVKVSGSFKESHSMAGETALPDPNQRSLPGYEETGPEPEMEAETTIEPHEEAERA